jgi:RNA polymerase sigma factor (sigma-70 family)
MSNELPNQHIGQISTRWSLIFQAHQGPAEASETAKQKLLERYGGAVLRYLRKVLPDRDGADEVFQEFAFRLLHGDLRGADPQRGRFRNFVKGTLVHLVADYRNRYRRWPKQLPADGAVLVTEPEDAEFDDQFTASFRDELLARAWAALEESDRHTGKLLFPVLRFRVDHMEMRSPQMAKLLTVQLGKPFTAAGVRQILHRAREKFAKLLLEEVAELLEQPSAECLHEELVELGLFEYCRPALTRQRPNQRSGSSE